MTFLDLHLASFFGCTAPTDLSNFSFGPFGMVEYILEETHVNYLSSAQVAHYANMSAGQNRGLRGVGRYLNI